MKREYVRKAVSVDVAQWLGDNRMDIWKVCSLCYFNTDLDTGDLKLMVQTSNGVIQAEVSDYVIRDENDQYSVCKEDYFHKIYEEVTNKNQHNENS